MPETISPEQLAAYDAAYWAVLNQVKLGVGVFAIYPDHPYQLGPMSGRDRRVAYMKGTQGGFSELEVLKTLHGLIYHRYGSGVLYLFPTTDDVNEFSKARFNPLIRANPMAIGRFVKSGGKKGTDTASLKKIHDAFLYLRGARLSQSVDAGGYEKESAKLRSVPVDRVVFDELDLMDEEAIAKALARMGHSKVKEEVYISNPTIPGHGIDKMYQQSDQRLWMRRCPCGEWFSAEETFPDCVRTNEQGRGYIACLKCGRDVPLYAGKGTAEWVAKKPDVSNLAGYRWSQLSSAFNDPADILKEFNDPHNPNVGDTYRLRLGLPYIPKEDQLTEGQVRDCCGPSLMAQSYKGSCAMGVDIGREFHVAIGVRSGKERLEILRLCRIPCQAKDVRMEEAWGKVHDLARAFGVRSAVIDIRPYEHQARAFRAAERFEVRLAEYTENVLQDGNFDEESGVLKAHRTMLHDTTHRLVSEKRLVLPRRCPEVDLFAEQVSAMAKVLETNKKTGVSVYRYSSSGPDHYRHALGYLWMASRRVSVESTGWESQRPRVALHQTSALA